MIKLYGYQAKQIKRARKALSKNYHVLCQSPTGSGKTIMFSYIAARVSEKGKKVLIITDRVELLSQAGGAIESFNMNPYLITAGTKYIDKTKTVFIAMAQTLRNRLNKPVWYNFIKRVVDLVIIDEAHIQEFNYLFEGELLKDKYVLGFTATPARSGKMMQLAAQYDKIVEGTRISWLIKKGYLVNCDTYDCGKPNLTGVAMNYHKGDYSESAMYQRFNTLKLYQGLIKNYRKYTPNQKMIVFCCSVEHAIKTTKKLNKAGIKAKFVCSQKQPPKEPTVWTKAKEEQYKERKKAYDLYVKYHEKYSGDREQIIKDFKASKYKVLVNVDIATKGFDCPDIEVVALYRATTSLTLYLQMLGRGGRTSLGKTHFTVLDFGGNKERFGSYDEDRRWELWHQESVKGGVPPMKICGEDKNGEKIKGAASVKEGCERMILASYSMCPFCGFKYPKLNKKQEIELQLASVVDKKGVSLKTKAFKDMSFEELTKYRAIKKHHINWLYRMLWLRDEEETVRQYAKQYNWSRARTARVIKICNDKY